MNENNEFIVEMWSRLKSHISVKERLEAADVFIEVLDEFGKVDHSLINEDLDKELRAAVKGYINDITDYDEYGDEE